MDDKLITIIISASVGGVVSVLAAYITSSFKMKSEIKSHEKDFALEFAKLTTENSDKTKEFKKQYMIGILTYDKQYYKKKENQPLIKELATGLLIQRDFDGSVLEKYFIIPISNITIGRESDNDIVISNDYYISRKHGEFLTINKEIYYQDFLPTNKTLINNKTIEKLVELKSGDKIKFGESNFEFILIGN